MTPITFVAARPTGGWLAVATADGDLLVWSPSEDLVVSRLRLPGWINAAGWTAEADYLLATAGDDLHVWGAEGGDGVIATGHGPLRTFAVHPSQPRW